jgi:hypothetical protein
MSTLQKSRLGGVAIAYWACGARQNETDRAGIHEILHQCQYNLCMARGWESKSVEEQMSVSQQSTSLGSGGMQQARQEQMRQASLARQRQALSLQRENILSQRTSNPNRRAALEAALAQIESQLQALG